MNAAIKYQHFNNNYLHLKIRVRASPGIYITGNYSLMPSKISTNIFERKKLERKKYTWTWIFYWLKQFTTWSRLYTSALTIAQNITILYSFFFFVYITFNTVKELFVVFTNIFSRTRSAFEILFEVAQIDRWISLYLSCISYVTHNTHIHTWSYKLVVLNNIHFSIQ